MWPEGQYLTQLSQLSLLALSPPHASQDELQITEQHFAFALKKLSNLRITVTTKIMRWLIIMIAAIVNLHDYLRLQPNLYSKVLHGTEAGVSPE